MWNEDIDWYTNPLNQRTQVYNQCWNMWVAMRCYLRRPLLLFHITIQPSWCAVYVWPTAVLTLHSQWRTVASFKEVLCWLSVSSGLNEDCCPVEGRDEVCFSEAHPGIPPPTPQWGLEETRAKELTTSHLCQDCILSLSHPTSSSFFFRIYRL